jgi:hypothetical protein
VLPFPRWKGEPRDGQCMHCVVARYTALARVVQCGVRVMANADESGRRATARTAGRGNARRNSAAEAERSTTWSARGAGSDTRDSEARTDMDDVGDGAAAGAQRAPAAEGGATAWAPGLGRNSCRFIATRFQ